MKKIFFSKTRNYKFLFYFQIFIFCSGEKKRTHNSRILFRKKLRTKSHHFCAPKKHAAESRNHNWRRTAGEETPKHVAMCSNQTDKLVVTSLGEKREPKSWNAKRRHQVALRSRSTKKCFLLFLIVNEFLFFLLSSTAFYVFEFWNLDFRVGLRFWTFEYVLPDRNLKRNGDFIL